MSTDNITGLLSDYKHGYYKISKDSDEIAYSKVSIEIKNNLPNSTYSALFYLYGYNNSSIITGDDLGPILFGARGINYHVLWYTDDDDSIQTKNHTKGLIWFTADGDGSIEIELRFFDKSITHFVVLSRCVEGKVNLGFSIGIFNVAHNNSGTFYFEDINMNNRKIKNLGGPTGGRDAANKKYVDIERTKARIDTSPFFLTDGSKDMTGDINMGKNIVWNLSYPINENDAASKAYVDDEVASINIDTSPFFLIDGSRRMTGNINMGGKIIKLLANPTNEMDASNKRYIDTEIAKVQSGDASGLLPRDGSRDMTGTLDMGNNDIDNLKTVVEDDGENPNYDQIKYKAINFELLKSTRDYLVRTIVDTEADLLPKDGSEAMTGVLDMNNNEIKNLKYPQPSDSSYAASVDFVHTTINDSNSIINGVIDNKIQESEERSIQAVQKENAFKKVMVDGLFVLDDDDIHNMGIVNKDFHKVNQMTYQFNIDLDSKIGYYSTRLGVNVVYLPISHYTIVFEMYFSNKIKKR